MCIALHKQVRVFSMGLSLLSSRLTFLVLLLQLSHIPCIAKKLDHIISSSRIHSSKLLYNALRNDSTVSQSSIAPSMSAMVSPGSPTTESVHLKLNERSSVCVGSEGREGDKEDGSSSATEAGASNNTIVIIDEFVDSRTNETIVAGVEGISFRELSCLSVHLYGENFTEIAQHEMSKVRIRSRSIDLASNDSLSAVLGLWRDGKLLIRSKEWPYNVLSNGYANPKVDKFKHTVESHITRMSRLAEDSPPTNDVLDQFLDQMKQSPGSTKSLREEFSFDPNMSTNGTLSLLKSFSVWFRGLFPYFYDNCSSCGNKHDNYHFGLIHPSPEEFSYQARVTELYQCSRCNEMSRFPRYNKAIKVLSTRAGRCGEYSMLMLCLLDRLGYSTRWIVDWNDHVWNEVKLGNGDWVHLDPCEASVAENLLYEGWGKKCTYIFAYSFVEPFAEDVTAKYTANFSASLVRRESDGISQVVIEESLTRAKELMKKISKM